MEFFEEDDYVFPHPRLADPDGILAAGGQMDVKALCTAYAFGIFPWYNHRNDPIFWWSPVPRFVIFPYKVNIAKSMRPYFNQGKFTVTYDQCFSAVIRQCEMMQRKGQLGTWINEDIIHAYSELHEMGLATSVEVWQDGELVGGLYGVSLGKMFFGESMFSKVSNASKFGFISLARKLEEGGFTVIDCQQPTDHLKSLGGEFIPREKWYSLLAANREIILKNDTWFE